MGRNTPFGNILKQLNVSIPTFTEKADRVAVHRNDQLTERKKRTGEDFVASPVIGLRNMSDYSNGRSTMPQKPELQDRIIDTIIVFFEKRYDDLSKDNYVELTTRFIEKIAANYPLDPQIFDYSAYTKMIREENLPDNPVDFPDFVQRCCFKDFLFSFIKSWDYIKDPDKKPSVPEFNRKFKTSDDNAVLPADREEVYLEQSLLNSDGKAVYHCDSRVEDNNLLFFDKEKLVLVTGPGGQGKSTFLRQLRHINIKSKTFSDIILIPLVALTSIDMDYRDRDFNIIFDYIAHRYPKVQFNNPKKKILLMLDGFNEYRTSKNSRAVENITGSLNDLINSLQIKGEDGNISLIVTTRDLKTTVKIFPVFQNFLALSLSGTPDSEYNLIRSMCMNQGVDFDHTELESLAQTPLYARLIKRLLEEGKAMEIEDRFSLFDKAHEARAGQRIGNTAERSIYPKNDYLYFYYIILPYFAYRIVTSGDLDNTYRFREEQIDSFLEEIRRNDLDRVMYTYLKDSDCFRYIDGECPRIDTHKLIEFFDNEEEFILNDIATSEYSFVHEQWRDYLAAVFLRNNVLILKKHYKDADDRIVKSVMTDLNVDVEISRLLRQSLNLYGGKQDNAARMKRLFCVDEGFYNRVDGAICLLHLGFSFCDYLQINLPIGDRGENESVHAILLPLSDYLLQNTENERLIDHILKDSQLVQFACELLSKEAEYYRRVMDYDKAYRVISLCKQLNSESVFTIQHEAKIYLCYFESVILNEAILSVPEDFNGLDIDDIREKGMKLLNRGSDMNFYLSINTLGLLLTNPCPYFISRGIISKPDFSEAFYRYINMITDSKYVRRDTSYTVHQALRLLVEYVTVDEDSLYNPEDSNSNPKELIVSRKRKLFSPIDGKKNLALANSLLNRCSGQELAGLNYLRGCIALASGDRQTAETFFESPLSYEWKILYHLMLKYHFGNENFDIDADFADLIKLIHVDLNGRVDKTHPVYRYIEAKELELSFLDGSQRDLRKAEFDAMEQNGGVADTVNMIMRFLIA